MSHETQKIRVGDLNSWCGCVVTEKDADTHVESVVDISTASAMTITIKRPDSTTFSRPGIFETNGVDGVIYFLSIAGDFSLEGTYYIQAHVVLPSWEGSSTIGDFEVEGNLA